MAWFKRNWRALLILAAGIVAGATGNHTIANKVATQVPGIVEAVPCLPGEACADAGGAK